MPIGSKNGDTQSGIPGQERPVVFQKYFKSGGRTYASQVKLATNGKKYLVLTEGIRDPETQEVKKHTIRVFESDLKTFFSLLQETVLFLRSTKGPGSSIAGVAAPKPVASQPAPATAKPTRPASVPMPASKSPANGNAKASPPRTTKPSAIPVSNARVAKPPYRPTGRSAGR